MEFFSLKRRKSSDASLEGVAFTYEERAELFEDLLEEDTSQFPLLEAPHEVLAAVGACLDAGQLAALSELCAQAHSHLDEAFADAWTALLLRDHMPRSRAKRYRATSTSTGEVQRAAHHSAGLVLTVVDLSRIEWDGLLVAAPSHLRYRFLQTMGALKNRWGRLAQSWEWFVTRVMHRVTHEQLQRFVPGYRPPAPGADAGEAFDEVSYQASKDRDFRQRQSECNPQDVIASMKRRLGIADTSAETAPTEEASTQAEGGTKEPSSEDCLSVMAPTARDRHQTERAAAAVAAASEGTTGAPAVVPAEVPSREVVERMSFSEQLDLALRISQTGDGEPSASERTEAPATAPVESTAEPAAQKPPESAGADDESSVLFKLKTSRSSQGESLEVVLREFTVGEAVAIPEVIRRSLEQIVLRLSRGDWLLFYEGIAMEAQLRARTVAHHCRMHWPEAAQQSARRLVDLEAVLLQLPLYDTEKACPVPSELAVSGSGESEERRLVMFLEAWEEHEAWAASLEEHVGPLDLEVSHERTHNMQHGRAHTPYATDLCRLAFRNFAICEGKLFFALAMAVYGLISRLFEGRGSSESRDLLESLHSMARTYRVQDDALAAQRSTLQEYRYYLLEPLRRASERLTPAWEKGDGDGEDGLIEEA